MNKLTFNKKAPARSQATHAKLVNRLEYFLQKADHVEYEQGLRWYSDAGAFCSNLATELDYSFIGCAQAVAILSPQIDWEQNKRNAALIASSGDRYTKIFATQDQKDNALLALIDCYRIPATARKTYSFAENIADPASARVTVDRHAVKAALCDYTATPVRITDLQYRKVEAAYQEVAKNHGLFPYQLQAIIWITYKRIVNR